MQDGAERDSIWQTTAVGPPYDHLTGDIETDVLVVGAGVTGLTCGVLLAEADAHVTVIEARSVGSGTTGGTTGKVTSQHGVIYQDLVEQHGEEVARGYGQANEDAIGTVRGLVQRHGLDADLDAAEAYVYTEDEGQIARLERETEVAQQLGLPARWSDETDLPFRVRGAVRFEGQAQMHALKYVHGLAAAFTGPLSGTLHERTRAVSLSDSSRGRVVETPHGTITAQHVILATLIPIMDRGFEFARAEPSTAYGIAARIDGQVPHGMYISAEQPTRSIRHYHTEDQAYVIVVGDDHRTGAEHDTGAHNDLLEAFARDRLGAGAAAYRWSAQDFLPVDLLPMIGEVPLAPEVYVATGLNKWGLTNGTVAASIISDVVLGRDNPYAEMLSNTRTTLTASASGFLRHNLDVAERFIGDRVSPDGRSVDDIPPGGAGVVLVDGAHLAVTKDDDGAVTERSAVCPHLGCIVQWNEAETSWDCPCHGSRYTPDGDVLCGPATSPLSAP